MDAVTLKQDYDKTSNIRSAELEALVLAQRLNMQVINHIVLCS